MNFQNLFLKPLETLVPYWFLGILYSCLFALLGGWFTLFIPRFSIVYSIYMSILFTFFGVIVEYVFTQKFLLRGLFIVALIAHFNYWVFHLSSLSVVSVYYSLPISLTFTVLLISGGIKLFNSNYSRKVLLMIILLGIGVCVAKFYILQNISVNRLGNHIKERIQINRFYTTDLFYPFSVPIDEGLNRYKIFLPDYQPQKSVILIVLDALREDFVGKKVSGMNVTPTISQVSEEGISFDRYYVQSNWTKPSTTSLFTGKYPHNHKNCFNYKGYHLTLPSEFETLAERLSSKDFYTAGSAFVSHLNEKTNYNQGFDLWISPDNNFLGDYNSHQKLLFEVVRKRPEKLFIYFHMKGGHTPYREGLKNTFFWKQTPYYKNGNIVFDSWSLPHPSELTRDKFDKWKQNQKNPFPTNKERKTLRFLYSSQLNWVDKQYLRRFVKGLKTVGIFDQSLLGITGDHGEDLFDVGFNKPGIFPKLNFNHMHNMRELVISPPLILKFPDSLQIPMNLEEKSPIVESLDITSTILDYAGLASEGINGNSLLKLKKKNSNISTNFNEAIVQDCQAIYRGVMMEQNHDLYEDFSKSELKHKVYISQTAYIKNNIKFVKDFWNDLVFYYNLEEDPLERDPKQDFKRQGALFDEFEKSIPSDTHLEPVKGKLIPKDQETRERLKGLGYVQ